MSLMKRTMRVGVVAALTLGAAAACPGWAAAESAVDGSWESIVNCAFTHYNPVSGAMGCEGSTLWSGTWTGTTRYQVRGTYDVLTGDSSGRLHEVFYGHDVDGRAGSLSFEERYVLVGASSTIHIDARIVSGTGDFRGANGRVTFDGTDTVEAGSGTYAGSWSPPPISTGAADHFLDTVRS